MFKKNENLKDKENCGRRSSVNNDLWKLLIKLKNYKQILKLTIKKVQKSLTNKNLNHGFSLRFISNVNHLVINQLFCAVYNVHLDKNNNGLRLV